MNEPGEIPLTNSDTPDTKPCSLISIIPTIGMSSCRGRAEAFARRLSSRLRTLGSQTDDEKDLPEDEPIINGISKNTWMPSGETDMVTELQPGRHETDSFFDYDCDLESPGSPVDECEYLRLIETASNTPHNSAAESGYACGSATSSHSSHDGHLNCNNDTTDDGNAASSLPKSLTKPINITEYSNYVHVLKPNNTENNQLNNEFNNTSSPASTNNSENSLQDHPETPSTTESQTQTKLSNHLYSNNKNTNLTNLNMKTNDSGFDVKVTAKQTFPLNNTKPYPLQREEDMIKIQNDILEELKNHSASLTAPPEINNDHDLQNNVDKEEKNNILLENRENGEIIENLQVSEKEISGENGEETLLVQGDQNHTYTFHHSMTNGQQTNDREEVLKIEVTTEENHSNGEPLKIDVSQAQENASLLIVSTEEREAASPLSDDGNDANKENLNSSKTNGNSNSNNQANETTDDEDECRPQRVRRCSSLKTGKTPPGTPGRKKIVRFADVLGLDLADVKTFLDEIPTIPRSAFMDLEIMDAEPPLQLGPRSDKLLMPLFQQPGGLPTFLDIVREKQVSLENASVTDVLNQTITGSVRVRNLDFHKSVYLRYTLDNWRSFADLQANYVPNSCDGFSDKFTFVIFGNSLQIGQRLEFAVRFQCKGQQYWDNNYGTNYCFQCLASGNPLANAVTNFVPATHPVSNVVGLLSPTAGDAWCNSFY